MAQPTVKTITVAGGNLFVLAAQYLGDATQWYRLANLNGLSDFIITGTASLKIPPTIPTSQSNGGILGI